MSDGNHAEALHASALGNREEQHQAADRRAKHQHLLRVVRSKQGNADQRERDRAGERARRIDRIDARDVAAKIGGSAGSQRERKACAPQDRRRKHRKRASQRVELNISDGVDAYARQEQRRRLPVRQHVHDRLRAEGDGGREQRLDQAERDSPAESARARRDPTNPPRPRPARNTARISEKV